MKKFFKSIIMGLGISTMVLSNATPIFAEHSIQSGTISGAVRSTVPQKVTITYIDFTYQDTDGQQVGHNSKLNVRINPYLLQDSESEHDTYQIQGQRGEAVALFPKGNNLTYQEKISLLNQTLAQEGYSFTVV